MRLIWMNRNVLAIKESGQYRPHTAPDISENYSEQVIYCENISFKIELLNSTGRALIKGSGNREVMKSSTAAGF